MTSSEIPVGSLVRVVLQDEFWSYAEKELGLEISGTYLVLGTTSKWGGYVTVLSSRGPTEMPLTTVELL